MCVSKNSIVHIEALIEDIDMQVNPYLHIPYLWIGPSHGIVKGAYKVIMLLLCSYHMPNASIEALL